MNSEAEHRVAFLDTTFPSCYVINQERSRNFLFVHLRSASTLRTTVVSGSKVSIGRCLRRNIQSGMLASYHWLRKFRGEDKPTRYRQEGRCQTWILPVVSEGDSLVWAMNDEESDGHVRSWKMPKCEDDKTRSCLPED
jgi:hypothetical protein